MGDEGGAAGGCEWRKQFDGGGSGLGAGEMVGGSGSRLGLEEAAREGWEWATRMYYVYK